MAWQLYLDDIRNPSDTWSHEVAELAPSEWTVARSTEEAKALVIARGMPTKMSLDHDLGDTDYVMIFLRWLTNEYWDEIAEIPWYAIHSANPVGAKNIQAFMDSWAKSIEIHA